jgi:hypothetical protein
LAFLIENLTGGQAVFVQGRLHPFEVTQDDKTLRAWEVIAEEVVPLPKASQPAQHPGAAERKDA